MKTQVYTIQELKDVFSEILVDKTDKVTKVSPNSIINGLMYGLSKNIQKGLKDASLVEAQLFPEYAYGDDLDEIAVRSGINERFGSLGSSTFLRIVAEKGTQYPIGTIFTSTDGFTFTNTTAIGPNDIGDIGFCFLPVYCREEGAITNVEANTITTVTPEPTGHLYVTNDFRAEGGRDRESDDSFKSRISEGFNILATDTLSKLEQVLMYLNNKVLRLVKAGKNNYNQLRFLIVTQNGAPLTSQELKQLESDSKRFLSLNDVDSGRISLENYDLWYNAAIDFRLGYAPYVDINQLRINIQTLISDYFNWQSWVPGTMINWTTLFEIVKSQGGVTDLLENNFHPNYNILTGEYQLPRVTSFVMRDLNGDVLLPDSGVTPQYYPRYVGLHNSVIYSNI